MGSFSGSRSVLMSLGMLALLVLSSCGNPAGPKAGDAEPTYPARTPTTIWWEPDATGYTRFYTDDSALVTTLGLTELHWMGPDEALLGSRALRAKVKKNSGDPTMGYGLLFDFVDSNNYFFIALDTMQYYKIGRIHGGSYASVVEWRQSGALYAGLGVANTVEIDFDPTKNKDRYALLVNGSPEATFDDPYPAPAGSTATCESGFFAGISSVEDFPANPVDVRFQRIIP